MPHISELLGDVLKPKPPRGYKLRCNDWPSFAGHAEISNCSWYLDIETCTLTLGDAKKHAWIYQIDLQHCRSVEEIWDWVCQCAEKSWAEEGRALGELVIALSDIFDREGMTDVRSYLRNRFVGS